MLNNLAYATDIWTLTKRDRKQMNIFERKAHRRILGPVYDIEKDNWRILTNKEIYAMVKIPTTTETVMLNRLPYFSIDNAHLMYNAHPKLLRHSF